MIHPAHPVLPVDGAAGAASLVLVMPLDHLGVIAVHGEDARAFLQGQLTNDMLALTPAQAQLNAYCSPKGRLLASFLNWTDGSMIYLAAPLDLLEALKKRLSMFVMRSKAKLEFATLSAFGLSGTDIPVALRPLFDNIPETVWGQSQSADGATLIRMPDANGTPRWICWLPAGAETAAAERSGAALLHGVLGTLPQGSSAIWRWLDIRAGLPWIVTATQEKFVPQMVNLEALGGVSFKKGCYPGQEVVARSQYLGKLKRRTALAHAECTEPPAPGSDVFAVDGSPAGVVVNAELSPSGGVDLLVELPLADRTALQLTPHGPALDLLELPYVLPDNEIFVRPKL